MRKSRLALSLVTALLSVSSGYAYCQDAEPNQLIIDKDSGYRNLGKSVIWNSHKGNGGLFLRVHLESNQWKINGYSENMPVRSSQQQEIFYVSKDKSTWYLAIPEASHLCERKDSEALEPYTICNSTFASYDIASAAFGAVITLGINLLATKSKKLNEEKVLQAIFSVPEADLNNYFAAMQKYKDEESAMVQKQRERRQQALMEEQRAEEDKAARNVEKMSRAPLGSEDSCRRLKIGASVYSDPKDTTMECQFGGLVTLMGLKNTGWLVVSKEKNSDNVVTNYYMRKAR